jgi:hypothetical protein
LGSIIVTLATAAAFAFAAAAAAGSVAAAAAVHNDGHMLVAAAAADQWEPGTQRKQDLQCARIVRWSVQKLKTSETEDEWGFVITPVGDPT